MLRAYKIPTELLFGSITLLIVGELACGTNLYFVTMMALAMLSIGVSYNVLGGLGTLSGILFSTFALRTLVISQIGKVFVFEPANLNLEAPMLTITMYALFYFCAMAGIFLSSRIRLELPKPLELESVNQARFVYAISMVVGVVATVLFDSYYLDQQNQGFNNERSAGLAFSGLLLFAFVIAVDSRIRATKGEHSFGWSALLPCLCVWFSSLVVTTRGGFVTPILVYYGTCYTRGYRFRRRHYVAGVAAILFFLTIFSPFELYSRSMVAGKNVRDRIDTTFHLVIDPPTKTQLDALGAHDVEQNPRSEYFDRAGFTILNRLSLIRFDSDLFSACADGFHYGFATIRNDLLLNVPRFLYPNKPNEDSAGFIGRVSGMNPDSVENGEVAESPIAESYGCFGWVGVALFGFFVFPLLFVVCESVFDVSRPWGTVAMGMLLPTFAEGGVGTYIVKIVKIPIYIILISYVLGGIARIFPYRRDAALHGQVDTSSSPDIVEDKFADQVI